MKRILVISLLLSIMFFHLSGQVPLKEITRAKDSLARATSDLSKINILLDISLDYRYSNIDSAIRYADEAVALSRKINHPSGEGNALMYKGNILLEAGDIPFALQNQYNALAIAESTGDKELEAFSINSIGNVYMETADYRKAIDHYKVSEKIFAKIKKIGIVHNELSNIGNVYELMGKLDSSKIYLQRVYEFSLTNTDRYALTYGEMRERLGNLYRHLGYPDTAMLHYRIGIHEALFDNDLRNLTALYLQMSKLFKTLHLYDSSMHYAQMTIETGEKVIWKKAIYEAAGIMADLFKIKNQTENALRYAEQSAAVKDSLYGPKKFQQLQLIMLHEQQRQLELQEEKNKLLNRYRLIGGLSALGVFLLIAVILWRNNREQQKTNRRLSEQKEQIAFQRNNLEKTLGDLKATQTQLIQSEKMASLGELTAGIAHEIQNPLNFVNNFSELNKELLNEMKDEIDKGNLDEVKAIANDVIENQLKINHHGNRADAIVKGMLQHSRNSGGVKEPTDINVLADEYLRLAYHGLRAKDKTFNATLNTDYDNTISNINIIPQDIGRVILNLITNAFYAVTEKKKQIADGYEPTVSVSTKKLNGMVEIKVWDNGNGIPRKVLDKIFQPFFTTKPTGQGTGLGLSLSYDIIKAHSGEIKVETKENEGAEFIIQLPVV